MILYGIIIVLALIGAGFGWIVFNHAKATKALADATAAAAAVKSAATSVTTPTK